MDFLLGVIFWMCRRGGERRRQRGPAAPPAAAPPAVCPAAAAPGTGRDHGVPPRGERPAGGRAETASPVEVAPLPSVRAQPPPGRPPYFAPPCASASAETGDRVMTLCNHSFCRECVRSAAPSASERDAGPCLPGGVRLRDLQSPGWIIPEGPTRCSAWAGAAGRRANANGPCAARSSRTDHATPPNRRACGRSRGESSSARAVQRPGHDAVQPQLLPRVHHQVPTNPPRARRVPVLSAVVRLRDLQPSAAAARRPLGAHARNTRDARPPRRCGKQIYNSTTSVGNCRCRGSSSSSSRGSGLGGGAATRGGANGKRRRDTAGGGSRGTRRLPWTHGRQATVISVEEVPTAPLPTCTARCR